MALNLKKGARFDLQKSSPDLLLVGIGLGWDPNSQTGGPAFDLDASAFMLDSNQKLANSKYLVFYGNPLSSDGAVKSSGDDKTGGNSDGDDETLFMDLGKVDKSIQQIIFTVTICKYPYDEAKDKRTGQLNFGQVKNCYIRVFNQINNEEILRFDLNERFTNEDAVEFGRLYRTGKGWEFEAIGKGVVGSLDVLISSFVNSNEKNSFNLAKGTSEIKKPFNLSKKASDIVDTVDPNSDVTLEKKGLNLAKSKTNSADDVKMIAESKKKSIEKVSEVKSTVLSGTKVQSNDQQTTNKSNSKSAAKIGIFLLVLIVVASIFYVYNRGGVVQDDQSNAGQQSNGAVPNQTKIDSSVASPNTSNESNKISRNDSGKQSAPQQVSDKISSTDGNNGSVNGKSVQEDQASQTSKVAPSIGAPRIACSFQPFSTHAELSNELIDQIKVAIQSTPNKKVIVEGFASSEGKLEINQQLSQKRADAVKKYLINRGIPENKILAIGKGIENPIASNDDQDGRTKNRRVEIVVK